MPPSSRPVRSAAAVTPGVLSDPARLVAVRRLLELGNLASLDRLTGLAAMLLRVPRAQVSLIGDEQVVAAASGLSSGQRESSPSCDSLCTVTLALGGPLAVTDGLRDDRVSALPAVASGQVTSYLGVPLVDRSGLSIGALCVYGDGVRTWTPEDVGILGEIATSVLAELELLGVTDELASGAARLELALGAAGAGSFDWHLDTGRLTWDDRLLDLFGYAREEFDERIESFSARVHPDDAARVEAALTATVSSGGDFVSEYRIVRPDASERRLVARGRVMGRTPTRAGRLLGIAYDATDLLDSRDRLAQVLATMSDAFLSVDLSWQLTWVNAEAERLLGRPSTQLVGTSLWSLDPDLLGDRAQYENATTADGLVRFERHAQTGAEYEVRVWPQPDGYGVYLLDISERRQAEAERERASRGREQAVVEREQAYASAEAANARLALLADATTRLSASLEPVAVLRTLADIVVPALGTWMVVAMPRDVAVDLRDGQAVDAELPVVFTRYGERRRDAELNEALAGLPLSLSDEHGPGAVLRTGRRQVTQTLFDDRQLGQLDAEQRDRLSAVGTGPVLTVPLISRGRRLGAVTVVAPSVEAGEGTFGRSLLDDLAGRAAVALDNALLYGAERRTGLTLQNSLLPRKLPQLPDLVTAVRYLPGAAGAYVGGDWYQGISVDGSLTLAIGDVMGHGMQSAARMGQLRAIVATLALEGHGPGELLGRLSAHVDQLLDLELATMLVARYDPAVRTLTVASAGHPPLLHAPNEDLPRYVDADPGPPLGTFAGRYDEVVVPLASTDTVVLFTDGLIESRDASLTDGLEKLRQALIEVRLPPEEVADHVLRTMGLVGGGEDDIALLVFSHVAPTEN